MDLDSLNESDPLSVCLGSPFILDFSKIDESRLNLYLKPSSNAGIAVKPI